MLNKLGYIELYISKTWIYQSFSEVPLPFKSMLITFYISNSSKSLESSQFRDQHTDQNQLTLLAFLTDIYHSYIEHLHFEHHENNQHFTVSFSSVGAIVSSIDIWVIYRLATLTLLSLICDTHEMNTQRQTSVISNFLYIEVFTQVPWTSIYPSFTVT